PCSRRSAAAPTPRSAACRTRRSEEHTSELQSLAYLVCRLLLEKKKCAIANTVAALEGGADCLDVTVMGIGERNGIASLSGLIAQLFIHYPEPPETYTLSLHDALPISLFAALGGGAYAALSGVPDK